MKKNKYLNVRGSLLLEALLAVVILSVSFTFIIQSLMASLRANIYSGEYIQASLYLENKLNTILQKGFIESNKNETGGLDKKGRFSYRIQTEIFEQDEDLNLVQLSAEWQHGSKKNKFVLETLLFATDQ